MARLNWQDDLIKARELAGRSYEAFKNGQISEAVAAAATGQLYLGFVELAKDVLANSANTSSAREREWRMFQTATGIDL